jgi:hypothetical protein
VRPHASPPSSRRPGSTACVPSGHLGSRPPPASATTHPECRKTSQVDVAHEKGLLVLTIGQRDKGELFAVAEVPLEDIWQLVDNADVGAGAVGELEVQEPSAIAQVEEASP